MKRVYRILVLAVIWGLAAAAVLNDIDVFALHDLFDVTAPHHEHIVIALVALGFVWLLWPRLRALRRDTLSETAQPIGDGPERRRSEPE